MNNITNFRYNFLLNKTPQNYINFMGEKNNSPKFTPLDKDTIDIKARGKYPSNVLSNLSDTNFELDGVKIKSMEGFLQSLKTNDPKRQKEICAMSGFDAKGVSKSLKQNKDDALYFWEGTPIKKGSKEFKTLLSDVVNTYRNSDKTKHFNYKGYEVNTVNTFLSALHSDNPEQQKNLAKMSETELKEGVKSVEYTYSPRKLYWNGKSFMRDSEEYNNLLTRAYEARFNADENFRKAIYDTQNKHLIHTRGKDNIGRTILTTEEFIGKLEGLRNLLGKFFK